jgi:hypothetical protein
VIAECYSVYFGILLQDGCVVLVHSVEQPPAALFARTWPGRILHEISLADLFIFFESADTSFIGVACKHFLPALKWQFLLHLP